MAFWASNLGRGSQIDTILDKEDVTLAEVSTFILISNLSGRHNPVGFIPALTQRGYPVTGIPNINKPNMS